MTTKLTTSSQGLTLYKSLINSIFSPNDEVHNKNENCKIGQSVKIAKNHENCITTSDTSTTANVHASDYKTDSTILEKPNFPIDSFTKCQKTEEAKLNRPEQEHNLYDTPISENKFDSRLATSYKNKVCENLLRTENYLANNCGFRAGSHKNNKEFLSDSIIPWIQTGRRNYIEDSISITDTCSNYTVIDIESESSVTDTETMENSPAVAPKRPQFKPGFDRDPSVSHINLAKIREQICKNNSSSVNPSDISLLPTPTESCFGKKLPDSSLNPSEVSLNSTPCVDVKEKPTFSKQVSVSSKCSNIDPSDSKVQTRQNNVLTMFFSFLLVVMLGSLLSRVLIIVFGFLYPAYSSFKTIRAANVKQYVRWMMYWVVFALFTASEYVTDVFISWLPFYYEIKVLLVIWLSSTYTRGASVVYRKVLHPLLARRERHIDKLIDQKQGEAITYLLDAGKRTVQAAATGAMNSMASVQGTQNDQNFTAKVAAVGMASSLMSSVGNFAGSLTNVNAENSGGARQRKTGGPKIREIIEEEDLDNDSFEE